MPLPVETSLPFEIGVATYPPGASLGPRIRNDYELIWMIQGDAEYQCDDKVIFVPVDSILLCRPGTVDIFRWDKNQRTRHAYVHFALEWIHEDLLPSESWQTVRRLPPSDIMRPLFQHLLTWHGREPEWQSRGTIGQMLTLFIAGELSVKSVDEASWPKPVERACSFLYRSIEAGASSAITLSDLAEVAGVTPQHLCRLFKTHLGHSPQAVQRLARLDYAVSLLVRSNYSISQISDLCGFANAFHFSRSFRTAYGYPPSAVRNAMTAGSKFPLPRLLRNVTSISID